MNYTPELQEKITQLGLQKENILYLTIQNVYLHDIRTGQKNVEYRDLTDFCLKKIFEKDSERNFKNPKPITHLLLQGGYSATSPRMLIECKGWVINGKSYPANADFKSYDFGILHSKMHMVWVDAVGGKLETRYRYSAKLCYNTFPFPEISEKQKLTINEYVFAILDERAKYPEKTMA